MKIIYIGGSGRSGSTVLTKLLNFWEGFTGVNEMCYLWRNGIHNNYPVSDGTIFSKSVFWQTVLKNVFPDGKITREQIDFFSQTNYVGLGNLARNMLRRKHSSGTSTVYETTTKRLYEAVAALSDAQYIIDSSKTPDYAYLLSRLDTVDLYFIHLVRDPRGVAYSWGKKFKRTDVQQGVDVEMASFGLLKGTFRWIKWNIGCELMRYRCKKYIRIRYEDFVQNPQQTLDTLTTWLGIHEGLPKYYLTEGGFHDIHRAQDVSIWGNPKVRNKQGAIRVKSDNAWIKKLGFGKKLVVVLLTLPFLIRYKYRIFH